MLTITTFVLGSSIEPLWAAADNPRGLAFVCLRSAAANADPIFISTGGDSLTLAPGEQLGPLPIGKLSNIQAGGDGMTLEVWYVN